MATPISMFRCANCGSSKVTPYANGKKQKSILLGAIKQTQFDEYECAACGQKLDHCMNEADKNAIDSMIVQAIDDERTKEYLKKYPNIEVDLAIHTIRNV